ncbi:MAG: hypothetical protein V1672_02160 [Candidatus Diapherotrites archaeon]
MDNKAQVSFEYLLTAVFGIMLAMIAALLIQGISGIAQAAQGRIAAYRTETISSLMQ